MLQYLRRHIGQTLRATGVDAVLTKYGADFWRANISTRDQYAVRYIRGSGLEIGALHNPQKVSSGVRVQYLDRLTYQECIERFPELDSADMVRPSVIDDGFELRNVQDASQDFLIANHVLEHSPNPLHVLTNWLRVVKPGGVLFITVPIVDACFDRGRSTTTLEHLIEDYQLCAEGRADEFKTRNLEHYLEWVRFSEPALLKEQGAPPLTNSEEQRRERAELLLHGEVDIHFHTFSVSSFKQLLDHVCNNVCANTRIQQYAPRGIEIIAVLKKPI